MIEETSEREGIVRSDKSKPDDFLRAKYEHMMKQFWTDRLPADSRGWKRKATRTTSSSGGSRGRLRKGHAKDIATQMAGICSSNLSEDYRLPFGNR